MLWHHSLYSNIEQQRLKQAFSLLQFFYNLDSFVSDKKPLYIVTHLKLLQTHSIFTTFCILDCQLHTFLRNFFLVDDPMCEVIHNHDLLKV